MNPTNSRPTCSFCGKYHAEVHKLIAGPGVCICDECVITCGELIAKEMPGWPEFLRCPNDPLRVTHDMLTAMRDAGEISDQVFTNRLAEATVREFTVSKSESPKQRRKNAPSRRRSK